VLNTEAFPDNKPIGIHLKIDTGMHRLGFEETSINKLIDLIQSCPKIEVRSVFSHLAGSDNPELDYFTKEQLQQFEQISQQIIQSFPYPILRHISNSAAITRFPEAQYDMVRLGIGLYGVASDTNLQAELKTVSQLKTIISQIKRISKGESVGYNRAFVADRDMQIATIPIGYADGYSRRFSQGVGQVMIHDHLLPIIGNVCMDMCMIDLQEIEAQEGDEVIIFGERPSIIDLAKSIGTIPYELFTSISQRVKRIYVQE
jgi:alanine racemase